MGGLSLTNPAMVSQDQSIDPLTGQPTLKPRVSFFPNNLARLRAFAQNEQSQVQPSTSTVEGSIDGTPTVGTIEPPNPVSPKLFKPSFASTLTDPTTGLPAPVNPAQTKLGKLVSILGAAARGAMAGWGYGNAAQGAAAAREIPFQEQQQQQQLRQQQAQTALTQSQASMQASMVPTPYGPMPLGMARYIFPSLIRGQATTQAAQIGANSRENVADTNAQSRQNVANINHRFTSVPGVGLFDTQTRQIMPGTEQGTLVTPEIAQDYNLPKEFVGKPLKLDTFSSLERAAAQYAPTVSSESSSTDLMGNTSTKRTTQKVQPGSAAAAPAGAAPVGPSFVQNVPGGPLVRQNPPAARPRPAAVAPNAAAPGGTPAAPAAKTNPPASTDPTLQLGPDVEQKLGQYTPAEQKVLRAYLAYAAPASPRGKNYSLLIGALHDADPNWSEDQYDARRKTRADYTPGGKIGQQAISFNTAIAHLGMLNDAADALHNQNVLLLNRVANFFGVQVGKDNVTTFNNIADAVDGEVAKTFKGTATEGELSRVGAHFNSSLGPGQIQNNIRSTVGLLNGKMGEMQSAYQRQMGRPIDMVSPEAKQTISRITPQQGGGGGSQQNGYKVGDVLVQGNQHFKVTKVDQNGKPLSADPQ